MDVLGVREWERHRESWGAPIPGTLQGRVDGQVGTRTFQDGLVGPEDASGRLRRATCRYTSVQVELHGVLQPEATALRMLEDGFLLALSAAAAREHGSSSVRIARGYPPSSRLSRGDWHREWS